MFYELPLEKPPFAEKHKQKRAPLEGGDHPPGREDEAPPEAEARGAVGTLARSGPFVFLDKHQTMQH